MTRKPRDINTYIAASPAEAQAVLRRLRSTIRTAVPEAKETISYGIPTFTLNGTYLVYFAGYKRHVSVHPVPAGDSALTRQIRPYLAGAGTLRFPLDEPIPYALISRVVKALRKRNRVRAAKRRAR